MDMGDIGTEFVGQRLFAEILRIAREDSYSMNAMRKFVTRICVYLYIHWLDDPWLFAYKL